MPRGKQYRKGERVNVLRQMYFSTNDENAVTLKYFNLRTSAACGFKK
jgi:hypothetical protein